MFGTSYSSNTGVVYKSASEINDAMGRVYGHMFEAVLVSMLVSYGVSTSPTLMAFFFTGFMKWITIFAPLAAVFAFVSFMNSNPQRWLARLALQAFAALMGLSFATIFSIYTSASIFSAFMGAAVLFALLSGYGYFTKKDLSGWGQFLIVGLIAIIIASIINIFIGSTALQMTLSAIGVLVFLGLTAYDSQRIRQELATSTSGAAEVSGALSLYLNFINLFLSLLQLFGNKEE